jgi:small multidrug resistance pump
MLLAWFALAAAIASEIAGTLALKSASGGSVSAVGLVVVGYATSFALMFAYAVWAGTGTAVIALVGMVALGEPTTAIKVASIALVIAGVVGLNLGGAH